MIRTAVLLLVVLGLSACGSILAGSTQDMRIETPGANDSVCYLDNGDMQYRAWPPETIRISKRPGDLIIKCVADGNRERTVVLNQMGHPAALGNTMNGILPGMFVDYHTGGLFKYPELVSVDFTGIEPGTMPLPNYHKHLMENPDLFGMEEFRPGRSALIRDRYAIIPTMQKRDDLPYYTGFDEFSSVIEGATSGDSGDGETAAEATQSSIVAPKAVGAPSDLVSDLTKQMNPDVFGPPGIAATGGTVQNDSSGEPSGVDAGPVTIYPMQGQ